MRRGNCKEKGREVKLSGRRVTMRMGVLRRRSVGRRGTEAEKDCEEKN